MKKPVTVINPFVVRDGRMEEFIDAQRGFATNLAGKSCGLVGGRLYRGLDGRSAVLVSQFESEQAQSDIRQSEDFRQHVGRLRDMVESAGPALYEVAYTTGEFR